MGWRKLVRGRRKRSQSGGRCQVEVRSVGLSGSEVQQEVPCWTLRTRLEQDASLGIVEYAFTKTARDVR